MYRSIVVGTDGSDSAKEAVRQAGELASEVGGNVLLVTAYEPVPESRLQQVRHNVPADASVGVNPRQEAQTILDEEAERLKAAGVSEVEILPREGSPAEAILDVAEEKKADLIVVGNKGMTGARRFLLGSVPNTVSHHARCNVMIVFTQ
jgi:nucleotide-binding universal stress UspA family protein